MKNKRREVTETDLFTHPRLSYVFPQAGNARDLFESKETTEERGYQEHKGGNRDTRESTFPYRKALLDNDKSISATGT